MPTEPPNAEPPKRKRRWFQFSLRSLLIVVTLTAVVGGYFGRHIEIMRQRKAILEGIVSHSGAYLAAESGRPWPNGPSLIDRMLGDEPIITISFSKSKENDRLGDLVRAFPEASFVELDDCVVYPPGTAPHFLFHGTIGIRR